MKLRWSRRATRDLLAIGSFIAADKPKAARTWVERLRARAVLAAKAPGTGRRVPEVARDDVREAILRTYRIVYLIRPKEIVVLTVIEGHRTLPQLDDD